jgi:hypothetical protein
MNTIAMQAFLRRTRALASADTIIKDLLNESDDNNLYKAALVGVIIICLSRGCLSGPVPWQTPRARVDEICNEYADLTAISDFGTAPLT